MSEPFAIVETPVPVPETVLQASPTDEIIQLLKQRYQLEQTRTAEARRATQAQREILLGILEVADALDRILLRPASNPDAPQALARLRGNVESTRRLLAQKLAHVGVSQIEMVGQPFDPHQADLDSYQTDPSLPEETVLREIARGYLWQGELLRRATVVVSQTS